MENQPFFWGGGGETLPPEKELEVVMSQLIQR